MNFNSKDLSQIDPAAPAASDQNGRENARRAARVELRNRVTVVPCPGGMAGTALQVEARDYSARGIRVIFPFRIEAGDQFVLYLPRQRGKPVHILCTAVHCHPDAGAKTFSVGAEFTCVLSKGASVIGVESVTNPDAAQELERIRQSILNETKSNAA